MKELNARLRESADEQIVDRASRYCQRGEALEYVKCARAGVSFDQPGETRYPQRRGTQGADTQIATGFGNSCEPPRPWAGETA